MPITGRKWLHYGFDGVGSVTSVAANGSLNPIHTYGTFSPNWSHIVSDGTHMLLYSKTDGAVVTARLTAGDHFESLYTYTGIDKNWSGIEATRNHVFIYYDRTSGRIATDTISSNGEIVQLKRYNP